MSPQYAILRFAKYKGPEISKIEAHNERTKEQYASNPDIDTCRTGKNFHLVKPKRKYRAEAERQIAEAGCRARSDSVRVVEALITASPEFFKGKKRSEVKAFFEEALLNKYIPGVESIYTRLKKYEKTYRELVNEKRKLGKELDASKVGILEQMKLLGEVEVLRRTVGMIPPEVLAAYRGNSASPGIEREK